MYYPSNLDDIDTKHLHQGGTIDRSDCVCILGWPGIRLCNQKRVILRGSWGWLSSYPIYNVCIL